MNSIFVSPIIFIVAGLLLILMILLVKELSEPLKIIALPGMVMSLIMLVIIYLLG
ncbi:hypothetical protein [Bacillus cereus]|uniref:hypothetical protein n=1 Tax=Bacillus cereus TaxID=1396 RepID=UPI000279D5D8|nr:hypothetical protein [Bacillus cereus]EJR72714.1 hypothetical protein IK9_05489 [Bacillus cereus VD166]